ncbi:transmembrane protein 267 [Pectinophora gossypiella]|uniref:transmembrane protein 267 n=1 Tax=Pectinophora gossypiella TaxID=13191 RepID=UPI00214E6BAC|nr:transmembrane protein 267 [Pectinophora gossypiella]
MRFLQIILSLSLCLTAITGDYIVFESKYSSSQVFRAFADSSVHASIGLLSATLFFTHEISISRYASVCNIIFCTILSSFIDIDHVMEAKSIYLKDMHNLKRGIFHCTTFWLIVSLLFILYSYVVKKLNIYILTFMIIIAYTSHHIRDGNRRGLWLYPFGHTPPISKFIYVALIGILPNIYAKIFTYMENGFYRHNVVNAGYKMVV